MTINTHYNLLNSGYYSLPQSGSGTVGAGKTSNTRTATPAPALASDLSAYLLDLSPEAQQYLEFGAPQNTNNISTPGSFSLSASQQEKLDTIMQKYKDTPYTQETFNQIQADLQKAGLSPDQLAAQEKVKSFNTLDTLMDALGGKKPDTDAPVFGPNEHEGYDTQKKNYLQKIIGQFQELAAQVTS